MIVKTNNYHGIYHTIIHNSHKQLTIKSIVLPDNSNSPVLSAYWVRYFASKAYQN